MAARRQAPTRQQELQVCLRCRARPAPWPTRWCRKPAFAPAASAAQHLQTRGQARRLQVLQDRRDHVRSAEGGHPRPLAGKGRSARLLVHPGTGPPPLLDTTAALVRYGHVYPPRDSVEALRQCSHALPAWPASGGSRAVSWLILTAHRPGERTRAARMQSLSPSLSAYSYSLRQRSRTVLRCSLAMTSALCFLRCVGTSRKVSDLETLLTKLGFRQPVP